jgi:hypothetical protein
MVRDVGVVDDDVNVVVTRDDIGVYVAVHEGVGVGFTDGGGRVEAGYLLVDVWAAVEARSGGLGQCRR